MEDLAEAFHTLSKRDQDIIGRSFGVYGYPKSDLTDIAIRNRMKEDSVEKAKLRALKRLREECLDRFSWKPQGGQNGGPGMRLLSLTEV